MQRYTTEFKEVIVDEHLDEVIAELDSAIANQQIDVFQKTLAENLTDLQAFLYNERYLIQNYPDKTTPLFYYVKIFTFMLASHNHEVIKNTWFQNHYLRDWFFGFPLQLRQDSVLDQIKDLRIYLIYLDVLKSGCVEVIRDIWQCPELQSIIVNSNSGQVLSDCMHLNYLANKDINDSFFSDWMAVVTQDKPAFMTDYYMALVKQDQKFVQENGDQIFQWLSGDVMLLNDGSEASITFLQLVKEYEIALINGHMHLAKKMIKEIPDLVAFYTYESSNISNVQFLNSLVVTLAHGDVELLGKLFISNPRSHAIIQQLPENERTQLSKIAAIYYPSGAAAQWFGLPSPVRMTQTSFNMYQPVMKANNQSENLDRSMGPPQPPSRIHLGSSS